MQRLSLGFFLTWLSCAILSCLASYLLTNIGFSLAYFSIKLNFLSLDGLLDCCETTPHGLHETLPTAFNCTRFVVFGISKFLVHNTAKHYVVGIQFTITTRSNCIKCNVSSEIDLKQQLDSSLTMWGLNNS